MKIKLFCLICLIALHGHAEITDTPCADGGRVIVKGILTGTYCMSKKNIGSWWNANTWCDAQGKQLVSMTDCGCDLKPSGCKAGNDCPNFYFPDEPTFWVWMKNPHNTTAARSVKHIGKEFNQPRSGNRYGEDTRAVRK